MKMKRKILSLKTSKRQAALIRDQHRADDTHLHNRQGGGALPSTLGWGQHKSKKTRITLFDPFNKGT